LVGNTQFKNSSFINNHNVIFVNNHNFFLTLILIFFIMTKSVNIRFLTAILAIAIVCCPGCKKKNGSDDDDGNGNGGSGSTVGLTINNLPDRPGQAYDVQVFQAETNLSTQMSWGAALLARKGLAIGSVTRQSSGNTFSLNVWDGMSGNNSANKWKGSGTFPVVLYDVNTGATMWHKIAQIAFAEGKATVNFSQFEAAW
jgi:hypothetical protein